MTEPSDSLAQVTTPVGVAVFPTLHETPGGRYRLDLQLASAAAHALISRIEPAMEVARVLAAAPDAGSGARLRRREVWKEQSDGSFCFGEIATTRQPPIFDRAGSRIPDGVRIGHGTTLRASIQLEPYVDHAVGEYGVRLLLGAVQVIRLRPWPETSGWGPNRIRRTMESRAERAAAAPAWAPEPGRTRSAGNETDPGNSDRTPRLPGTLGVAPHDPPTGELIHRSTGWLETAPPKSDPAPAPPAEPPADPETALAEVVRAAVADAISEALANLGPVSVPAAAIVSAEPESSSDQRHDGTP
jgi:hypothetical protein